MSKDFERAYRELAKSEAPDLWDRIEAGLGEKSTQDEPCAEPGTERAAAPDRELSHRGKKFLFMIRKYSAMAAAVICAIIIIPALIRVNRSSGFLENDSSNAAADTTAAEESREEAAEAAAEEPAEEGGEIAEGQTAASEEKMSGESMPVAEAQTAAGAMEDLSDGEEKLSQSLRAEKAEATSAEDQPEDDNACKETVLSHVILKVTGSADLSQEENPEEIGVVYTAVVRKAPGGLLKEGEEITVFIPAVSSIALMEGAAFELDLCPQENEKYSFVVSGYYNQTEE